MGMNYTADAYELIEKRLAAYNHFIRTFDRFNEKTIKWRGVFQKSTKLKSTFEKPINYNVYE